MRVRLAARWAAPERNAPVEDEDITEPDRPESTLASKVAWLFVATGIHLFLWSLLFTLLYWFVPRQKAIFNDFGVAISVVTTAIIHLSDFVVDYWYLAMPVVCAGVIIADCLAIFPTRSTALRLVLLALLAIPPVVLSVLSYMFPQHEVRMLMEQLR
jgi:hypothetical protein